MHYSPPATSHLAGPRTLPSPTRAVEPPDALTQHLDCLYPPVPSASLTSQFLAGSGGDDHDEHNALLDRRLHEALILPVRHLLDSGGRRWRPRVMAAAMEALGQDSQRYWPLMAACELGHTGSLMIDDIQDDSPLRRGQPAAHTRFGAPTTINAGTTAYFAMELAIQQVLPAAPGLQASVYHSYLSGWRAAHAGQALDLQGHRREMSRALDTGEFHQLLRTVDTTHRLKSGAPVRASMDIAALVAAATDGQRAALAALGEAIGTAYQIIDDVADLKGVFDHRGATKRVAEDLHNTKVTYPLVHAMALLPPAEARRVWTSLCNDPQADGITHVAELIATSGALDRCEESARRLLDEAWAALEAEVPDSREREHLRVLVLSTVFQERVA
ncbi:polyprenyl synthetase family protein [Streptomyces sp. NPDC057798]|uniref:polyprenyl synthetase family protein n=1 Tax=Streptomyces sp. NPDC057798 TaxID=3346252 RepID=UPI00368C5282